MPRLPVVFGKLATPSSSSSAFVSAAPSRIIANVTPGPGSRSMRSSSACSGSAAVFGHTWKPRQPMFTAHSTCARSTATSASEVVPFGVDTRVVVSHGSVFVGVTRFWKNDVPPTPLGKRCSSTGRPPIAAISGSATAR